MRKKVIKICLLFMIATLLVPVNVLAYSYGDPTKEDVAETFNLIKIKLSSSPPDWSAAYEAYKVRRAEISSHFAESVAVTLDHNFEIKEKDLVIENYRYVLYLNLERRFDYAEKDINDYGKVKILLGKAKGTYDVLKPYIESKSSGEIISNLETAFEVALESIGNPGLFGMGKKPVNPEEFKKQATYILTTLKPLFTYKKYTPEQPQKETQESNETTKQTQNSSVNNESETKQEQKTANEKEGSKDQGTVQDQASSTESTKNDSTSVSSDEQKTAKEEQNITEEDQTDENVNEEDKTTVATTGEQKLETITDQKEEGNQQEDDQHREQSTNKQIASASTEHAPVVQTDKTNPFFTVLIILGVLAVLIGSIWFARKKNFI
jgi:hypothetical protein